MVLTPENYHSPEARAEYISSSDVRMARQCEARWRARDLGLYEPSEDTTAFAYGHLFEAALTGETEHYIQTHPELCLTRGAGKGQLRAAYADAPELAGAVRRNAFLSEIIDRSRKQVILTGKLCGLKARVMMDLLDTDGSIYDIKSARNFRPVWDDERGEYREWWSARDYPVQLWFYRELAHQNGITVPRTGLIAGSKADLDVEALVFGAETMQAAEADAQYTLSRMAAIRAGDEPEGCGRCEWCLSKKQITEFQEV